MTDTIERLVFCYLPRLSVQAVRVAFFKNNYRSGSLCNIVPQGAKGTQGLLGNSGCN